MKKKMAELTALPLEERLKYINRLRKGRLFLFVVSIVLASLLGVGGLTGLVLSLTLEFPNEALKWVLLGFSVACWPFLMSFFIIVSLGQTPRYRKAFYLLFGPTAAEGLYEEFQLSYQPAGKAYFALLRGARSFVNKEADPTSGSYYAGSYRGIRFASFAFQSVGSASKHRGALSIESERGRRGTLSLSRWGSRELGGRYFSFLLPSESPVSVVIKDRRYIALLRKQPGTWHPFRSESIRYEDTFASYYEGDDEEAAYAFFSPRFIKGLLSLDDEFAGYFSMCLAKKEARCLYDHYDSGLRLSLGKEATLKTLGFLKAELSLPKRIIDAVFSKESD